MAQPRDSATVDVVTFGCDCRCIRHASATVDVVTFGPEPLAPVPVLCTGLPLYAVTASDPPVVARMCGPCCRWWRAEKPALVRDYAMFEGLEWLQRLVVEILWHLLTQDVDGAWSTLFADAGRVTTGAQQVWGRVTVDVRALGAGLDGPAPAEHVARWARTYGLWLPTLDQLAGDDLLDLLSAEYRRPRLELGAGL